MKRLFIVPGWAENSEDKEQPVISWMGKVAAEAGFETSILKMPNPTVPTIDAWTKHLDDTVGYVDQDTYFIGHSLGCQAVLRYLEMNKGSNVGGCIFIAPALVIVGLETQEEKDIARPWMERPIDFANIRKMSDKFVAIFSDNDSVTPLEMNKDLLVKSLNPKVIVEHNKGHFSEEDGVVDLPVVVGELAAFK